MSNCNIPQFIQGSYIPIILTHKDSLGNVRNISAAVLGSSLIVFIDEDGNATSKVPQFSNTGEDGKLEYPVTAADVFLTIGCWKVYSVIHFTATNVQISKVGEFEVVAAGV